MRDVFEGILDEFKKFSNSNGETNARKGTESRPALWRACECISCLTKPHCGYEIRGSRVFRFNVKRLEDADTEERGECKQECRYARKNSKSTEASFEQECIMLKRLRKVSGIAMEVNRDEVAQRGLWLKDYRPSLNDTQSLHDVSWIDKICLVLNQAVFPPLVWILLLSLRLESPSLLDHKFQRLIPHTSCAITVLQGHHTTSLIIVLCLSGLTVLALLKTPATMSERNRSFTYPCCTLSLVAGSSIWIKISGSVLGLFLVLMPYALSVGVSVGIFLSLQGLSGRKRSTEPLVRVPMFSSSS